MIVSFTSDLILLHAVPVCLLRAMSTVVSLWLLYFMTSGYPLILYRYAKLDVSRVSFSRTESIRR